MQDTLSITACSPRTSLCNVDTVWNVERILTSHTHEQTGADGPTVPAVVAVLMTAKASFVALKGEKPFIEKGPFVEALEK